MPNHTALPATSDERSKRDPRINILYCTCTFHGCFRTSIVSCVVLKYTRCDALTCPKTLYIGACQWYLCTLVHSERAEQLIAHFHGSYSTRTLKKLVLLLLLLLFSQSIGDIPTSPSGGDQGSGEVGCGERDAISHTTHCCSRVVESNVSSK